MSGSIGHEQRPMIVLLICPYMTEREVTGVRKALEKAASVEHPQAWLHLSLAVEGEADAEGVKSS
ncbi:MAG: hypothetical protein SGPRY_011887 [Prymnesium sp.]